MYRIGQLNRCIRIERDERQPDGVGGFVQVPVVVAELHAMYRNKSTRELLKAQQVQSTGTGVFVIRNRNDLLPRDRIVMAGQRFNIVGIPPYDPRDSFLEIDAENGVAN